MATSETSNTINSSSLRNKIAIVTGGSRGIGAAIAKELARCGAKVAITYVSNSEAANEIVKQITTSFGTEAVAIQANSRDKSSPDHIIQSTLKAFTSDGIDILVNNAGVNANKHFSEATPDDFDEIFEANVRGPTFLVQAALKVLRKGGRVITISSMATRTQSNASLALYTGTKGAMEALTRAWASSYPELGCTFNCVLPGPVETEILQNMDPEFIIALKNMSPEKRIATTDDVAQVVGFLATDGSRWINGASIPVTGAAVMF